VDNPKLTNQANPDALSPAPPASSPPEPLIRDRFLSGMNQVLTILRDLDCPLDVRVTMAHDVADAALRSMLASSPPEPTGVELIAAERTRQIQAEGWTPEHDNEHADHELAMAAESYIRQACVPNVDMHIPPDPWPWELSWWKPSEDPIRNLVKAGALIAAEIDRLQRLPALPPEPSNG
jgi:hypothetical protein